MNVREKAYPDDEASFRVRIPIKQFYRLPMSYQTIAKDDKIIGIFCIARNGKIEMVLDPTSDRIFGDGVLENPSGRRIRLGDPGKRLPVKLLMQEKIWVGRSSERRMSGDGHK